MEFEKHVKIRQEKFGAVIFETLREKVFVTNEVGAGILCLLGENKEPVDITHELAKSYNCDPGVIKGDVEEFVLELEKSGIARRNNDRK